MSGNAAPIFSRVGDVQGGVILTTAAADYNGQNVNNAVAFTADSTNGGYIQRIRFKPLGTNVASVARIYVNSGLSRLAAACSAVVGTPTGTPSASGGTLAAGNYYARIVAIDVFGAPTTGSSETAAVAVIGTTGSITWNWSAVAGAASYMIFVGLVSGSQATYFTSTTNSFTQTTAIGQRDSLNGSTLNNYFYGELSLPVTTISATTALVELDYPLNFALPPNGRILVGLGTTVAAGWAVTGIGGKY